MGIYGGRIRESRSREPAFVPCVDLHRLFRTWQDIMTRQCLDKDIRISPAKGRVHVLFDDAEIASSLNALEVDEPGEPLRIYLPRGDVREDVLELSDTRTT